MTRSELNHEFVNNLERERNNLNFTQKQMASKLEMSLSAYKRLITLSTDRIDLYVIYRLYKLTGKLAYEFTSISDPNLELKKKISKLTSSQLTYIEELVDFEKAFSDKDLVPDDYLTVYVPTGNMEDGMILDSANIEKVHLPNFRMRYGNQISCGIRITSNHLHPVYNKGDILLIAQKSIRDGDTGIFVNHENGRAYIRKFYQTSPCRLEPINSFGEVLLVDNSSREDMEKWIKFGRVIAKTRCDVNP